MGVNTLIYIPNDVWLIDLSEVIGILLGIKPEKSQLTKDAWSVKVKGVSVSGSANVAECAWIKIKQSKKLITGNEAISLFYHYECSNDPNYRLIMPRSRPAWIALGLRLIQFFGGLIDFDDSDDIEIDRGYFKPRGRNNPEDGKEWQDYQEAIFNIKPLTKKEIEDAKQYAAYTE